MALQLWSAEESRRIRQRIIVEGDLVLQTPAHLGAGDGNELIDMPLLLDAYDQKTPLLTGASIAGSLRSYLRSREVGYGQPLPDRQDEQYHARVAEERRRAAVKLFGGFRADDEGQQSPLIIEDAYGQEGTFSVELRTGVQIDSKGRTAKRGALYDIQLWQAGTIFPLRFELLLCRQFKKHREGKVEPFSAEEQAQYEADLKQALVTALAGFSNGSITLGARKRRGYGQVLVTGWRVKTYQLSDPAQLVDWLAKGDEPLPAAATTEQLQMPEEIIADLQRKLVVAELISDKRRQFHLQAVFSLDGSLLIRSGGGQDDVGPDMVHLKSRRPGQEKGAPIVSGTSLAGALRARANRIANTLDKSESNTAKEMVYKLFGPDMNDKEWAKGKESKERVQASRLLVKETVVENSRTDLVQNRVSIDRFTGGARETALFDQQPLFARDETRITVDLRLLNPQEYEIGMLMLLLKDLWMGDLPLGGESSVGRGRLKGKEAKLTYRNGTEQQWRITAAGERLEQLEITSDTNSSQQALEDFVVALNEHLAPKRRQP